jgi:hypothetical protein
LWIGQSVGLTRECTLVTLLRKPYLCRHAAPHSELL